MISHSKNLFVLLCLISIGGLLYLSITEISVLNNHIEILSARNMQLEASIDVLSDLIAEHELALGELEKQYIAYESNVDELGNNMTEILAFMYDKFYFEIE